MITHTLARTINVLEARHGGSVYDGDISNMPVYMCYTGPAQYEYQANSVFILLKVFGIFLSVVLFKKIR